MADESKTQPSTTTPSTSLPNSATETNIKQSQAGADPNGILLELTPLRYATHRGESEIIKYLLEAGADPNRADWNGEKPIEISAFQGHLQDVKTLFSVTSSITACLEWSVDEIVRHVCSRKAFQKRKRKAKEVLLETKLKAEDSFRNKEYDMAVYWYAVAGLMDDQDATLLSKRSECWTLMGKAESTLADAMRCITLRSDWSETYYRKGVALNLGKEKENGVEVVKGMNGVINVTQGLTVIDTLVRGRELLEDLKDHFTRAYDSGMAYSKEFAVGIFGALARRRRQKINRVTKEELYDFWADSKEDGRIAREEVQELIILSASTNKLSKLKEQAQEYASLIMEELDPKNLEYIELWHLEGLLLQRENYLNHGRPVSVASVSWTHNKGSVKPRNILRRISRTLRCYILDNWQRGWIIMVWVVTMALLFTWKFNQYRNKAAFQVMGYCLTTTKGVVEILKLNMALILLPVCRNTLTWLRSTRARLFVLFDDNINFPKYIHSQTNEVISTNEEMTTIHSIELNFWNNLCACGRNKIINRLKEVCQEKLALSIGDQLWDNKGDWLFDLLKKTAVSTLEKKRASMYILLQVEMLIIYNEHKQKISYNQVTSTPAEPSSEIAHAQGQKAHINGEEILKKTRRLVHRKLDFISQ
ncbi:hypothetical protein GIB67_024791 [Kingdonia uniflora]|uniref:NADPH oxidase Respiratory burst domain-containing protein n=1 Tax=Kingdonia uniflora TaxID=39325 RepID=A0A7J7NYB5_9MAGN|nr:hypothetical protein GIB67_024791 [Kingdonia uniflora]